MRYFSTRNENLSFSFQEVILKGIAPDGGLFVPEKIPHLTSQEITQFSNKNYKEIIFHLFKKFEMDFSDGEIKKLTEKAFSKFDHPEIAPLVPLKENIYLIELFHGPTSAFKDMALQVMPLFFELALKKLNLRRKEAWKQPLRYLILVATSGDTGTAALEGFKNKENVEITVLYPKGGVSDLQELQMVTQDGENQHVFGIEGNFDDAQNSVKFIFTDSNFIKKMEEINVNLSSANSINWGRLLPQIGYYITSYLNLLKMGKIKLGEEINVTVPTGNFGNILAAYYAKLMGIPIKKLICASNQNKILYDFFTTGKYDLRGRQLVKTPSPSMDILISSNLERLLFHLTKDTQQIRKWMEELKQKGFFIVDNHLQEQLQKIFYAGWCDNNTTLKNIARIYNETAYLMDPHTSVGEYVAENYIKATGDQTPMVVASTAHWAKFGIDVYKAINGYKYEDEPDELTGKSGVEIVRIISQKTEKKIPENINKLDKLPIVHDKVLPADPTIIEEELEKLMR